MHDIIRSCPDYHRPSVDISSANDIPRIYSTLMPARDGHIPDPSSGTAQENTGTRSLMSVTEKTNMHIRVQDFMIEQSGRI